VRTELGLPIEESDAYQTVAGFLVHALGAIPDPGTSVTRSGHRWTVLSMSGPKIVRVKVQPETGHSAMAT
jgi:putative hemolysin